MNPGKLRHRVAILEKQTTVDPDGYPVNTWVAVTTLWVSVEPIAGREYFRAAAVQAQHQVRFTMRYQKGITSDMRLRYAEQDYEIKAVLDLGGDHKWLQVMAEVITSG
jgi:SPP1 family predicted phage head-tail adaptor